MSEIDKAILLTWNPEKVNQGGSGTKGYNTGLGVGETGRWNCNTTKAEVGDRIFLIRLGIEPRGIVASGVITGAPYMDVDWADAKKKKRYIEFKVDDLRESCADGLLPIILLSAALSEQQWSTQTSGIAIVNGVLPTLEQLWHEGKGKHSLRQFVDWSNSNFTPRAMEWLEKYGQIIALLKDIRERKRSIGDEELRAIWKEPANGIAFVAQGTMGNDDFENGKGLLKDLTQKIADKPDAETMQNVLFSWKNAVEKGAFSKMHHLVINRVFAASSPQRFTTIVQKSQCKELLSILENQFQCSALKPMVDDWVHLCAAIEASMRKAGLQDEYLLKNNISMWELLKKSSVAQQASDPDGENLDSPISETSARYAMSSDPLNQILYGPPGTGKTYSVVDEALKICDAEFYVQFERERYKLKSRFDGLVEAGAIRFVTFHQSFSYEDFVEGLRAVAGSDGSLSYEVVDGIFKKICLDAVGAPKNTPVGRFNDPKVFSSIDRSSRFFHVRYGSAGSSDEKIDQALYSNVLEVGDRIVPTAGDYVFLLDGNKYIRAFGFFEEEDLSFDLSRKGKRTNLPVTWLKKFGKNYSADDFLEPRSAVDAEYELKPVKIKFNALEAALNPSGNMAAESALQSQPVVNGNFVLIIDEINRGNISRIFGELITLIEPSKRVGAEEMLEVTLPYSKAKFSVPSNVYLIGTMNTADRSLAGLDIALRRRFTFVEMPPRPELLKDVAIEGIKIDRLLSGINDRIEVLLDRDHCLGHAYFMSLKNADSLSQLAAIFRNQIVPLLQEYFFEDWQRIQWVLNDHRKAEENQFITKPKTNHQELFGDGVDVAGRGVRWQINEIAFMRVEAYLGIISVGQEQPQ